MTDNKNYIWLNILSVLTTFVTLLYTITVSVIALSFYFFGTTVRTTVDDLAGTTTTVTTAGGNIIPIVMVFVGYVILVFIYALIADELK